MSVLAVVITADSPMPECLQAIEAEGIPVHINRMEPQVYDGHPINNKYENCSRNREAARQHVLSATEHDYFLFVDDDIIIPPGTVHKLLRHQLSQRRNGENRTVVAGWYPILGTNRYVAGRWVADNTFYNFTHVHPSVVRTDCIGMGCAMFSRELLRLVHFEAGTKWFCTDAISKQPMILGECGLIGNACLDIGVFPLIDGDVVCKHLDRNFTSKV